MLRHQDLYYVYDTDKLSVGGTYSNENMLVRLLADSSIGGIWCANDDQQYCGKWRTDFYLDGKRMTALKTEFAPEYQRTRYSESGVTINKTVFVPLTGDRLNIVFVVVEVHNAGKVEHTFGISGDVRFPEIGWAEYVKNPDPYQREKRVHSEPSKTLIVSRTVGKENEVRAIGGGIQISEAQCDDQSASIVFQTVALSPGQAVTIPLGMAISNLGTEDVLMTLAEIENHRNRFYATQAHIDEHVIQRCQVGTPDGVINRAVAWAKVNSFRQRSKYPSGYGFTNDPPQDTVVVRDAAWFVFGSDYFMPEFSSDMLDLVRRHGVEDSGMITEYIQCCEDPPYHYDYDLNINDDTPLFIISVHHHFVITRNEGFLNQFYSTIRNAIEWVLQQKIGGLIYCATEESNVWGICSWRNIIPAYTLNGAVTEINSECYRALVCMSELAGFLHLDEDAVRYAHEAGLLKEAINQKLISGHTGYYMLNVDTKEREHHDLTGDMIFPVMFDVADSEMARKTLDLLHTPMFWTEHGSRTVAKGEHNYDPEYGIRLLGGIWPNLTVWVTYANRKFYPNRVVEGMRNAYRICEVDTPRHFKNCVPGEFPECLHGENFESRGMALSPWMPPTYLWLAVEGLIGIEPTIAGLTIDPHIPDTWKWSALKRVPYAGSFFSLFLFERTVYSTVSIDSKWPAVLFDEDLSDLVKSNAFVLCFKKRGAEAVVLVAADSAVHVDLTVPGIVTGGAEFAMRFSLQAGGARMLRFSNGVLESESVV